MASKLGYYFTNYGNSHATELNWGSA